MLTLILFIAILSLLVFVHEWGHFVMAKRFGMRVYEFGFGFPPRALGVYRDPQTKKWRVVRGSGKSTLKNTGGGSDRKEEFPSTVYSINWLPLGGFVKIKGESGEARDERDSFSGQSVGRRFLVLVAGVSMNFVLAAVLLGIGLSIGLPFDFSGGVDADAIIVEPPRVLIQHVSEDSPASEAGILFGDIVKKINGVGVESASGMTDLVRQSRTEPLELLVERDGKEMTFTVSARSIEGDTPRIGVMLADAGVIRYPWYIALYKGCIAAIVGVVNIIVSFYLLFKNLILGQGLLFDVAGPVGIAVVVGRSAALGVLHLLNVTAMLSLSLAVINILPIPALDGGRALFVVIEKIIRRPVSMKYEQLAHTIGFILLLFLILIVTFRDIAGLF